MGIIVLAVAILPLLGIGGSQIMRTETPGPMKDTKLTPRITETAKGLWLVYALMTLACILAFKAVGMGWFRRPSCIRFSTLSLGGFSSHDASFAYFNSPAIEATAIFFMLVGGIQFRNPLLAFRRLSFAPTAATPKRGAYVALLAVSVLGVAYFLFANHVYPSFWDRAAPQRVQTSSRSRRQPGREHRFQSMADLRAVWMLFLCCFATCSGSTRRRNQDDSRRADGPAGASGNHAHHPPARIICPSSSQAKGCEQHHLRGAGVHADLGGR